MTTTVTGSGDEVHRGLGIANDKKLTLAEHTRKSRLTREVKSAGGDANMKGKHQQSCFIIGIKMLRG